MDKIKKRKNLGGQGLTEYALIIVVIAIVVIVAISLFGESTRKSYENIIASLGATLPPPSSETKTYCSADMSGLSGWDFQGNQSNKWLADNGQICMKNTGGSNYAYNQCSRDTMPENSDYVVKLSGATLLEGNGYGIMLRTQNYTASPSGYSFQYDPGANYFLFRKWNNGVESILARYRPPSYTWHNVPRDVVVEMKGSTMNAYIDGVLVLTAEDDTYSSGGAGLRTWYGTSACFDDFQITQITP